MIDLIKTNIFIMHINDNKDKRILILNKKIESVKNEEIKKRGKEFLEEIFTLKKMIKQEKNQFLIVKILKDKYIIKINNLNYENKIDFDFIIDSKEYKYSSKILKIDNEEKTIELEYPEEVECYNLKNTECKEPFSFFWKEKNIEYIGEIENISEKNMILNLSSDYLDKDFIKFLYNLKDKKEKYETSILFYIEENLNTEKTENNILFEMNLNYFPIIVRVLDFEEKFKSITIKTEICFYDLNEEKMIKEIIKIKEKEEEIKAKKEKTKNLLENIFL